MEQLNLQAVNAIASINISSEVTKDFLSSNLNDMVNELKNDFTRGESVKSNIRGMENEISSRTLLDKFNFFKDNISTIRNRILQEQTKGIELTIDVAKKQSGLILFNIYISQLMAQQQTTITNQQRELENQNDQLKENQGELKKNQDTIRVHQDKITEQNERISQESQEIMKLYKHFENVGLKVGENININELISKLKGFVDEVKAKSTEENQKTKDVLTQKINDQQQVINNETDNKLQKFNTHFSDLQSEQKNSLKEVTSECAKRQAELESFKQEQHKQITKRDEESIHQLKTLQSSLEQSISQNLAETGKKYNELQTEQKGKLSEVASECAKRQTELEAFKQEQLKQINQRGEEAGQQIKALQNSLEQTIKQNLTETGKKYNELQVEQKSKLDELTKDFATMQTANENQKKELLQSFDDLKEQHKNNFEELKLAQGEKLALLEEENSKLKEQINTLTSNEELLKASVAKNKIFSYVGIAAFLLVVYNLLVTYQVI